jgi:hypothetical protein
MIARNPPADSTKDIGHDAGVFEAMAYDLRMLLREETDRMPQPRSSSTAARCSPPRRAERGPGKTGTSGARGARSAPPSIRSGICWPLS